MIIRPTFWAIPEVPFKVFVAVLSVAAAEEKLRVPDVAERGGVVLTAGAADGGARQPRHGGEAALPDHGLMTCRVLLPHRETQTAFLLCLLDGTSLAGFYGLDGGVL